MTAVDRVAIAGSGIAACATAIQLARAGVHVELFETRAEGVAPGSGISLQGNALRAFDHLGVWPELQAQGFAFDGIAIRAPGPEAQVLAELPDVKAGGPAYPASMGISRPVLSQVLLDAALRAGAQVHFGSTVTGFDDQGDSVEVHVDGAPAGAFDLLVGADGLNSAVRTAMGIGTTPEPTGMGIWRASVARPAEVVRTELYYGGPAYIAGYTPTSDERMYVILVQDALDRAHVTATDATARMIELTRGYGGPWNAIRRGLEGGADVNYTNFTSHLVEGAWNRGRVVIIGDAAHSCPPTIAQGAAQGLEDSLVLAELLLAGDTADQAMWDAFHERRVDRARMVVDASVQLGRWQLEHDRTGDAPGLITSVAQRLAVPA